MAEKRVGIVSLGAYVPYYYMERASMGAAWGGRGSKGRRSVANSDEDSITMSVEAARDCLRGSDRAGVTHLFHATTTSPYGEKSGATLVSTACSLRRDVMSADFNTSLRSAASALRLALDCAAAQPGAEIVVTAADTRNADPQSSEEQVFGDAAAAALVGTEHVIAELIGFACVDNEIHDVWRNEYDRTVSTTERRFAIDEGYLRSVPEAVGAALSKAGISAGQIARLAMNSPGLKEYAKAAAKCGFAPEQVQDPLMMEVGDCGCAHTLLVLASAMERAQAGDIITAVFYGSGASAFVFRVTEEVGAWCRRVVSKFLARRAELREYARFLSFRGLAVPKQGEPFKIPAAPSITWRDQGAYLRLEAGTCLSCGCKTFPADRVCYRCRSKDTLTVESRSEARSKLFSFSVDKLAGRSDDPTVVQAIADDDQGIRFYMNMTDFREEELHIGMELEFTFRKIHELAHLPNYYWKFRPIRCPEESEAR